MVLPLIEQHGLVTPRGKDKGKPQELMGKYFSRQLVRQYEAAHGAIPGLYYEARGHFQEPHGGVTIPMGTLEVRGYRIPNYLYNKVLYIEKRGVEPVLTAGRIQARYDIGIMFGEGFATGAARDLAKLAEVKGLTILALHDCDVAGYQIGWTLGEETTLRPNQVISVIDIGLSVADVHRLGLQTEPWDPKHKPSREFKDRLTPEEFDFLIRDKRRCELNAMTSGQLIGFIEEKLEAHGLTSKVIPPESVVTDLYTQRAEEDMRATVAVLAELAVARYIGKSMEDLVEEAYDMAIDGFEIPDGFTEAMSADLHGTSRPWPWSAYTVRAASTAARDWCDTRQEAIVDALEEGMGG
jgi:hypothetical protein